MIKLMSRISFIETEKYLGVRDRDRAKDFLAWNCSLKSPPYCSIDNEELMHMAAWFGRTDILQYLIIEEEKLYPSTCITNMQERNTLWYACRYNYIDDNTFWSNEGPSSDAIQLLIETGCSIFSVDDSYRLSLFKCVCSKQDLDMLKALTSVAESVNVQDREGNTPLMTVIKGGHDDKKLQFVNEASKFLIQDRDCLTNNEGYSALHLACESESLLDVVKIMDLSHIQNLRKRVKTPCELAIMHRNLKILELFLNRMLIPNEQLLHLLKLSLKKKQKNVRSKKAPEEN